MSIEDIPKKINSIGIILVIILFGTLGVGIIKILPISTPDIAVSYLSQTSNVQAIGTSENIAELNVTGQVVASKNSKIYHLLTCPGAKTIKPENKVVFASRDLAEKAGFIPAKNCKGLK